MIDNATRRFTERTSEEVEFLDLIRCPNGESGGGGEGETVREGLRVERRHDTDVSEIHVAERETAGGVDDRWMITGGEDTGLAMDPEGGQGDRLGAESHGLLPLQLSFLLVDVEDDESSVTQGDKDIVLIFQCRETNTTRLDFPA